MDKSLKGLTDELNSEESGFFMGIYLYHKNIIYDSVLNKLMYSTMKIGLRNKKIIRNIFLSFNTIYAHYHKKLDTSLLLTNEEICNNFEDILSSLYVSCLKKDELLITFHSKMEKSQFFSYIDLPSNETRNQKNKFNKICNLPRSNLDTIFSFFNFQEYARNRIICKDFLISLSPIKKNIVGGLDLIKLRDNGILNGLELAINYNSKFFSYLKVRSTTNLLKTYGYSNAPYLFSNTQYNFIYNNNVTEIKNVTIHDEINKKFWICTNSLEILTIISSSNCQIKLNNFLKLNNKDEKKRKNDIENEMEPKKKKKKKKKIKKKIKKNKKKKWKENKN